MKFLMEYEREVFFLFSDKECLAVTNLRDPEVGYVLYEKGYERRKCSTFVSFNSKSWTQVSKKQAIEFLILKGLEEKDTLPS